MPVIEARVEAQVASIQLAPFRSERKRIRIHNDATPALRIRKGAPASGQAFTTDILGGGDWVENTRDPVYGYWLAADPVGSALVTEDV